MPNYYLGVDVSKGYANFVILDKKKQPVEADFQLDDTFDGHCLLYTKIRKFCEDHPESYIYAGVESTGGYENNWLNSLGNFQSPLNLKVARLNPLGVNANSRADLKRITTDKISAQNVAEYLIAHPEKVLYQQEDSLASLRRQWKFINMLTKQETQLINQLESLIYTANTELLAYCKDGVPEWVLKLLTRYPTASQLSRAKATSIAQIPYVSFARAQELIAAAKKSVASSVDRFMAQLIMSLTKEILHLKKTIKSQIKVMTKEYPIPEIGLLKSFTGIGDYSAIGLMLEIQTVARFPSVKKLASFFGIHPIYKISGDGAGGFRMSKKGRKEPRRILFMVAMNAITTNPHIRDIYQEHVERGMEKMAAIGLCMHKILRIIYGMLKHNKPFDPEIDRKNREKSISNPKRVSKDKSRRYQDFDSKAPISRRQSMKRKERKLSQSGDNATECGIIVSVPISNLTYPSTLCTGGIVTIQER